MKDKWKTFITQVDKISMRFASTALYAYILSVIISLPTIIYYSRIGSISYALYVALFCFMLSSFFAYLLSSNRTIFKVIRLFVITLLTLLCVVFIYGQLQFGLALPIDSLAPMAQTNFSEAKEFISFNIPIFVFGCIGFIIVAYIFFLLTFKDIKNKCIARLAVFPQVVLFLLSVVATIHNPSVITDYIRCNDISTVFENSVDLREHLTHPTVIETDQDHPQDIVIIIGESYTKYHSSLYGYKKQTNPCLQKLVKEGYLVVFDSVESPEVSTTPTFKHLLNTHIRNDKRKWYETTTIQEYFKTAGYHLTWISNQQQYGALNNISSGQSALCDESYFHGGEGQTKDMEVVNTYRRLKHRTERNLYFFHLYGQHPEFDKRFPQEFAQFKPLDYNVPENQRLILAAYDNATLYNDSVVSAIISCFKNKDALVVYLADHGLDLFYTDPNYYAHGRPSDAKSDKIARQVPFMVYMSEQFKKDHSVLANKIQALKSVPFCTEVFIYKLLDFTGYKLEEDGNNE